MAIVKIRSPFLATDRGTAMANDKSLPPWRTQDQLRKHHRGHQEHRAGSDAAALLGDFNPQTRDREHEAILCDRNTDCCEEHTRGPGRPLLQQMDVSILRYDDES